MTLDTSEWVGGTVWLFACHPSPKGAQRRAKKELHLPVIYPTRKKGECVSEHLVSPIVWDTAKGVRFALTPSRVLDQKFCYREGGSKSLGEWQIGILKDIKGTWILTVWQISLRSSPMSSWECLTSGFPQMSHRHPQWSICLTIHRTSHSSLARSMCTLSMVAQAGFGRWLVSLGRKLEESVVFQDPEEA